MSPGDGGPPRLTSAMLVSALVRRVNGAGGFATVIHHGDDRAGAILVECSDRGQSDMLLERITEFDGSIGWRSVAAATGEDPGARSERLSRRLRSDPDLWVIELDIPDAQRFVAEMTSTA